MQTTFKVCKLYLFMCLALSINASPILYGIKNTPSNYYQDGSSFHHESSFSSQPSYANMEIKSNLPDEQILKTTPGITTTFRDQNGNLVTQVKKEIFDSDNGKNLHAFEFQENKQLPNGYSKSFKKEYSSSSIIGSEPTTFIQTPLSVDKFYNSEKLINGESSVFGQSLQNQGSYSSSNSDYFGTKSNLKSTVGQSMTNTPGVTSTFRDQNGNLVTQVKKEAINNENGQNSHVIEFEENKQLPNGYSKSFKKEYSSTSVTGSQPTTFVQIPINNNKYYNSEKLINGESSVFGQSLQNQGSYTSSNSDYFGTKSNLKSTVGQSMTNIPGVTFRDQNGNIVTQVKKEAVNNDNGQNSHVIEFEENKQLPNGYSKSFKKEYSSSSVTGSQPTTFVQIPINNDKYYNSEKLINGESSVFGQSLQNQGSYSSSNSDYFGTKSNLKSTVGQSMTNTPGVTSTFRDQNGNLVTQVKKEAINNENGKNSHVIEFEETKQLPNGYSKSFKKEYSSSSVTGSQPTTFIQTPINNDKYHNNEQLINGESSVFGQSLQNQGSYSSSNSDYFGTKSNLKSTVGQSITNIPGVTSTFRDQNGNLVTQVKKEAVDNDNGQNSHVFEFEETKQLPNGYSKSFKKEYSSSSVIGSQPTTFIQNPIGFNPSLIKDTTTEINVLSPKNFTYGETVNFKGYNTFFNNQKYPLNTSGQITSKVINNKNSTDSHGPNNGQQSANIDNLYTPKTPIGQQSLDLHGFKKPSPIGQQSVNIDTLYTPKTPNGQQYEKIESFSTQTQEVGQQSVDLHSFQKPSPIGQESVNIDNLYLPKKPIQQQFEKIESFSTQTQGVGQQSLDLHSFQKPSPIGQESVNIDTLYTPKTSNGQYEKIESFSTQTQQKVGQQSVDFNDYQKPLSNGQESVNIDNLYSPKKPNRQQYEKIESFSTQGVGQQSVDLHSFKKPSPIGQESVNIDTLYTPKNSNGQYEKIESFSTQTQQKVGQQSVDFNDYQKPLSNGQESVNIDNLYSPKKPNRQQYEKIESFSTQGVGQQSVDLHSFQKPSPIGQESLNIDTLYTPKKPNGQQFEKIESFSTQTQEVGQQSVDLHSFQKPSPIGQESVNIDNLYLPKKPIQQQFEKIESFSTQTQGVGQQSVDLHSFQKPSPIGQESVNIDTLYTPKNSNGQYEKIESFSTQTQQKVGQQSVDFNDYQKPLSNGQESVNIDNLYSPKKPNRQQYEKIESFSTQGVGQQSVDLHSFQKPSPIGQESVNIDLYTTENPDCQQFDSYQQGYNSVRQPVNINTIGKSTQQGFSQPSAGQQIQGLEFLSNYGETTHLLDLGQKPTYYNKESTLGQQNINNGKLLSSKPTGQQIVGVIEGHSTIEENIDLSSDHLTSDFDNYQTMHGTSMKSPNIQGQQTIDFTGDYEKPTQTFKKQYGNADFQISDFSTGKLVSGKDQPIKTTYNSAFDKLGQLEHEILGAKSTVNINQDNHQTSYSTNHNIKSMPVQTNQQQKSYFSKHTNENTQYIEPESEIVSGTNDQQFSSSSFIKESKSIVQQDTIENQTLNKETVQEPPTTQSSFLKRFGDKVKGTMQNAKNKAQQLATTINDKVGFSKETVTENPC